jgi:hypothetical protein
MARNPDESSADRLILGQLFRCDRVRSTHVLVNGPQGAVGVSLENLCRASEADIEPIATTIRERSGHGIMERVRGDSEVGS